MSDPMPDSTKDALAKVSASNLPRADGPYDCLRCGAGIRTPRVLLNGKIGYRCRTRLGDHVDEPYAETFATVTFCGQECYDAWVRQFHLPGPSWPVYHVDEDGSRRVVAYVVPGKGRVTLDEIESAREGGA